MKDGRSVIGLTLAALLAGCPALATAAALEESEAEEHAPRGTAASAAPPASAAAAAPTGARYTMIVGEAVSPTDPKIARPTSVFSPDAHVSIMFETSAESFGMPGVDVTLYKVDGGSRQVVTHRRSNLKATDDVLYKSWRMKARGSYLVEVKSPSGEVLATVPFEIR